MENGCGSERRRDALASLRNRRTRSREDTGDRGGTSEAVTDNDIPPTEARSVGTADTVVSGVEEEVLPAAPVPPAESVTEPPAAASQISKTVKQMAWLCQECGNECVPIRDESRCLCGHRMKEHNKGDNSQPFKCKNGRCACKRFFLIVAEGSWVLRCRCKHKHTDHNALTHKCDKPKCECQRFHSPWVCNCSHAWVSHKQVMVEREVLTLEGMMAAAALESDAGAVEVPANHFQTEVNRFDMLRRGL